MNLKKFTNWFVLTNIMIVLFTHCSKEEPVTPINNPIKTDKRDKFVGTWYASGTWTLQNNGQTVTIPITDTFQFQLSIVDTIKIVDDFENRNYIFYVNNANQFTHDDKTGKDVIPINGTPIDFTLTERNILGTYNNNGTITYTSTTALYPTQGGTTINGQINVTFTKK